MKIGLLTYYGDLNCGTNLQAYASLKAIQETYPHAAVEIIPFHGFRQRILPYMSNATVQSLINDLRRISAYHSFKKHCLGVVKDRVITHVPKALRFIEQQRYDIIYVGADTLLELDRLPHGSEEITAYWLAPQIASRKILLAASCKNVEYERLSPLRREKLQATLSSFDAYGVRDVTTYNLLQHFVDSEQIQLIPDPTFTLPIDYLFIEQYLTRHSITIPRQSICFNTYRTDKWVESVANRLKQKGFTIVSLRPAPWADIVLNGLSPFEQLGVYRYFKLIVTHRFHDSIFALKNGTPPLVYVADTSYTTEQGESKCASLIKQFELYPQHIIDNNNDFTVEVFLDKIDAIINSYELRRESVDAKLKAYKEQYYKFLKSTL